MIFKKVPNPKKSASKAERVSGLSNYIAEPAKQKGREKCIHFGVLGFVCDDLKSQQAEMLALATDAIRSADPINHYVLSWRAGERPTPEQADEAALMFVQHLALAGHQVFYGLHDDTDNMHMHVMVNRVNPDSGTVVEINKGFDKKAGHEAIAKIEHAQGWSKERNGLYDVSDGKVIKRERSTERERQPTAEKQDREHRTGEQSAERIAITDAGPIIKAAQTWQQLHQALAELGMRYERKGSGALIFVGEIGVKASNVDRGASFTVLQKRLGPYQERSHDCIVPDLSNLTPAQLAKGARRVLNRNIDPRTPFDNILHLDEHRARLAADRRGGLHELSARSLDARRQDGEVLLQNDVQVHMGDSRSGQDQDLRRTSTRPGSGASERVSGRSTGRAARPLKENQPAWSEYTAAREAQKVGKKTATEAIKARHKAESESLFERLKAERTAALAGDWRRKGTQRNALASVLAIQQAAAKAALREQQSAERKALQKQFQPLPVYPEWRIAPAVTGTLVLDDGEEKRERARLAQGFAKKLSTTLLQLQYEQNKNGHVVYRSQGRDIFRDEGQRLAVLDPNSDGAIAIALTVAQQKYGRTLTLTGDLAFQQRVATVAVAMGMSIVFANPAMEEYRKRLKLNQGTETRVTRLSEHADVQASATPTDLPISPIQPVRAVEPVAALAAVLLPTKLLQQKNLQEKPLQPVSGLTQLPSVPTHVAAPSAAPVMLENDQEMATRQDHELVNQTTSKRKFPPRCEPNVIEQKAIDEKLVEQTKRRLAFEEKWQGLAVATRDDLRGGTVVDQLADRTVYHVGRGRHVIGPGPIKKDDIGKGQDR